MVTNVNRFLIGILPGFALGFLLGVLAISFLGNLWLNSERDRFQNVMKIDIIAANEDLEKGTLITADKVGVKAVFRSGLPLSRVVNPSDAGKILGKPAINSIKKFEPILKTDVADSHDSL